MGLPPASSERTHPINTDNIFKDPSQAFRLLSTFSNMSVLPAAVLSFFFFSPLI